ncbi:hypothetical protein SPRG_12414 [Saprolegnia parasitica CBS 223.65]|uniref:GAF domain-containing protein n=1 Tax=Saprolegnia parasitica (strain CBS 223.65) TaxID=695850 RepID=A0A067C3L4_SAPPC|nr:hypothetical protein SPRG_12414 [Saprolegnia parasitica CBS 223.65]KDO21407.1 hypothetical protein SPRG_12414 [Saprolegnia parasitica CBS 223.65]|eukprot:XP_012207854.1 hypothetical protein SPRG_12414 [Saprolegnia parasitica CBS 223.65]
MDAIQCEEATFVEHRERKTVVVHAETAELSSVTEVSLDLAWDDPYRLHWVHKLKLKDETLMFLNEIAKKELKYPVMAVSWINETCQRFQYKGETIELSRHQSFCSNVVASREPLVVLDTTQDDRFKAHPLVSGNGPNPFGAPVRFVASAPICHDGYVVGTMFALDFVPHTPTPDELKHMLSHMHALASTAVIVIDGCFNDAVAAENDMPRQGRMSMCQRFMCGAW